MDNAKKIEQCQNDIKTLEENLKKLQEPKVGDKYRHKYDDNVRMICSIDGKEFFVTIDNSKCSYPGHFPLGESYPFSLDKKSIIDGISVWEKVA